MFALRKITLTFRCILHQIEHSNIYDMVTIMLHKLRAYYELTTLPVPSLSISVGKALHQYQRVMNLFQV